jgi:hypothetical protein
VHLGAVLGRWFRIFFFFFLAVQPAYYCRRRDRYTADYRRQLHGKPHSRIQYIWGAPSAANSILQGWGMRWRGANGHNYRGFLARPMGTSVGVYDDRGRWWQIYWCALWRQPGTRHSPGLFCSLVGLLCLNIGSLLTLDTLAQILHWFSKTKENTNDRHACFLPPPLDRPCVVVCRKDEACAYLTYTDDLSKGWLLPTLHTIFVKASHRRMGCASQLLTGFFRYTQKK